MSTRDSENLREVCFLVDHDGEVFWQDTDDDPGYLEDRRDRWTAIWENRDRLAVIAHSHPCGPAGFSSEDLSSMKAICAGLYFWPQFSVTHPGGTIVWNGYDSHQRYVLPVFLEPAWARELRVASGMIDERDDSQLREALDALEQEVRRDLIRRYCHHCGDIQPEDWRICQCSNDE